MPDKIVVSMETNEELEDTIKIVKYFNCSYKVYKSFKRNGVLKYPAKIIDMILFITYLSRLNDSDILVIGAPTLRNRVAYSLLDFNYIMYLRCLHSNSENLPFISDKIDFMFKKLGINSKITNPYKADCHIVTSNITEQFLINRKSQKEIFNIGAPWLEDITINESLHDKRIVFILQAFEEHNLSQAQDDQNKMIKKLSNYLQQSDSGYNLYLKPHPRDLTNYHGYNCIKDSALKLLRQASPDDIFISTFSTLGFELSSLGADVKFITYTSTKFFDDMYHKHNIRFYKVEANTDLSFIFSKKKTYNIFGKLNLKLIRGVLLQ